MSVHRNNAQENKPSALAFWSCYSSVYKSLQNHNMHKSHHLSVIVSSIIKSATQFRVCVSLMRRKVTTVIKISMRVNYPIIFKKYQAVALCTYPPEK